MGLNVYRSGKESVEQYSCPPVHVGYATLNNCQVTNAHAITEIYNDDSFQLQLFN